MRTIRALQIEDVETLSRIEAESFHSPWSAKLIEELLQHSHAWTFVALEEDIPVGYVAVTVLGDEADIDKVVVEPSLRGQGIATQLLEELFAQGAERGILDYTLEVRVSNLPAIHLYEKMGFLSEGIRPHYYPDGESAMIMWRRHPQGKL